VIVVRGDCALPRGSMTSSRRPSGDTS